MKNFALIGSAGYIAPRHLKAIQATGNRLVASYDPHDSVGVLDQYYPDAAFFTEFERFDRHLELLRHDGDEEAVHYVSICSPNYLHDAHIRLALRVGAHAICEKPLVINPWNLDALEALEREHGTRVHTVLQLRVHPDILRIRDELRKRPAGRASVTLRYVTARGTWYQYSWKGDEARSGGVVANIGVHFFDLLLWLFGAPVSERTTVREPRRAAGTMQLERADVRWFLSIDRADLPGNAAAQGRTTFREITIDGERLDFTDGFTDLHTRVYEDVLQGRGCGIPAARPAIELVHRIRTTPLTVGPMWWKDTSLTP